MKNITTVNDGFLKINKNPMKKLVVAWDLDGTLIDSSHRVNFDDNNEFDLNAWIRDCTEENIFKDKLLPLYDLFKEYNKTGFTQICVTARALTDIDLRYLEEKGLYFDMILFRDNSNALDEVLKNRRLTELFDEEGLIPFQAFDDKQENLDVFDRFGFRTFHAVYMNEKLSANSYQELMKKPADFVKKSI